MTWKTKTNQKKKRKFVNAHTATRRTYAICVAVKSVINTSGTMLVIRVYDKRYADVSKLTSNLL